MRKAENKILVVDDEPLICDFLYDALKSKGYSVVAVNNGQEAMNILRHDAVSAVISDVKMPKMSGSVLLKRVKELFPSLPVIMITGYGSVNDAVEIMKQGATDYIPKPFSVSKLHEVVEKSITSRIFEYKSNREIITEDKNMIKILETIDIVASTNNRASVLIQGESGTGKELIARAIHNRDKYRDGDFVAVNCAALPENLLESELFGHEQGAFTGAIERRIGKFELANKGTLLLDEIAEMAPSLQAKLLRVLQEEEIDRVGGTKPIKVDVRVVATTNRNIEKEIKEGNFRGDLYYRLDVIPIVVPPLRNRHRDIKILALYFLDKFSSQIGKKIPDISKKALNALENYNWPGNVRELENVIKRAVMLCRGSELSVRNFFPDKISSIYSENWIPVGISLQEMEKQLILKTLESVGGNRTKAADMLGITTRTIRNKLQQYSEGDSIGKGD